MAAAVNEPMRAQSRARPWPRRAIRAEALLIEITSSEVPTATGIEKPSTRTSAGTTTKPPPTPKKPVKSPTTVAVRTTAAGARAHTAKD